ncbi:MAG: flagellar basal body rod C-terminal domain-containing protein, partial [Candidatus Margulisiibacteriota bacterium]
SLNGVLFIASNKLPLEFILEEDYKIRQGYIENSNVNSVEQLTKLASKKTYDLKAKILQMELGKITKTSDMLK